jgi:hypothetical protein
MQDRLFWSIKLVLEFVEPLLSFIYYSLYWLRNCLENNQPGTRFTSIFHKHHDCYSIDMPPPNIANEQDDPAKRAETNQIPVSSSTVLIETQHQIDEGGEEAPVSTIMTCGSPI